MYIYIYINIIYIRYRRDMRRVLDVPMGEIEIFPYIWNRSPMPSEWRHRPAIDHLRSPSAPYLHLCPPPTPSTAPLPINQVATRAHTSLRTRSLYSIYSDFIRTPLSLPTIQCTSTAPLVITQVSTHAHAQAT